VLWVRALVAAYRDLSGHWFGDPVAKESGLRWRIPPHSASPEYRVDANAGPFVGGGRVPLPL
jgi:hypothetical protein